MMDLTMLSTYQYEKEMHVRDLALDALEQYEGNTQMAQDVLRKGANEMRNDGRNTGDGDLLQAASRWKQAAQRLRDGIVTIKNEVM